MPARTELLELLRVPYQFIPNSFHELSNLFVGLDGFDVQNTVKVHHAEL